MSQKLRGKMTYANVVATMALVFAMTGGAYAASKIIITSTKQIKGSVLKQLEKQGPKGAQGAAGPQGSPGAQGPAGAAGTAGTAGTNGISVTSVESKTKAIGPCQQGGSEFVAASGTTYACNGKDGETGFTKTLPKGQTETGAWFLQMAEAPGIKGFAGTAISFNIPLEAALTESQVFYIEPGATAPPQCPGSAEEPKAAEGDLCVYANVQEELLPNAIGVIHDPSMPLGNVKGASRNGAILVLKQETEGGYADGAWAVTAG
jgi:hypothetical protein